MTDVIEPPVADHRGEAALAPKLTLPPTRCPHSPRDEAMALIERCETAARTGAPLARSDALDVLRVADADTVAVVSAAGRIRRAALRQHRQDELPGEPQVGPVPGGLQLLLAASRVRGRDHDLSHGRRRRGGRRRPSGPWRPVPRAVCLVASGRGPTEGEIEQVADAVMAVRDAHPGLEVCACLGFLAEGQAERLAEAGVDTYNHNLNTSEAHYGDICATHGFDDRVNTVESAKHAGLSPCSGALFGMGETDDDIVDVGFALRALEVDSVPINFLIPIDGTPLAGRWELTPQRCLRILALYRFLFPTTEIRIAGGREVHLRSVQGLALEAANSIFVGDYLTTEGQAANADLQLLDDWGFVPLDLPDDLRPESERSVPGRRRPARTRGRELVRIRRRGVGSELPPNA